MFISDTHGRHRDLKFMPEKDKVDMIVHTGDFTARRSTEKVDFIDFVEWFESLNAKYKIFVAGNHDGFLYNHSEEAKEFLQDKNVIYLEDSAVIIEGLKIYGTPWTPLFYNWYFMLKEVELKEKYEKIPLDTDILLTHGPAYGILDKALPYHSSVGSTALKERINQLNKLKINAFGHIHEKVGIIKKNNKIFINSAQFLKNEKIIINV